MKRAAIAGGRPARGADEFTQSAQAFAERCRRARRYPVLGLDEGTRRSYRYMVINNRLLLVDPANGIVVAEVTD